MPLDDFISPERESTRNADEHRLIFRCLNKVFDSGYVENQIREHIKSEFREAGVIIEINDIAQPPNAPYTWKRTPRTTDTWPVLVAEWVQSEEPMYSRRYQQAAARATEHLACSASTGVTSAVSRGTFYEAIDHDHEMRGTIHISRPSAECIRDILDEIERVIKCQESSYVEQIKSEHDTDV